jgi:PDZ domain
VTTKTQKVDNIGYLIPAVIVQAFLGRLDATGGVYALSGSIPYRCHTLENHSLRLAHNVPDSVHGVLITSVCESVLGSGSLRRGDILTRVDESDVADDGQVILRGDELIQHAYLMRVKRYNEPVLFTVYRDDKYVQCPPCVLRDIRPIIPRWEDVDWMPNYMILGSVVLLPFFLAMKNAKQCGSLLKADCIDYYQKWPDEWEGKEGLVVLTEIFAHELSFSYTRPWRRVISYNGVPIVSLQHLQEMWTASCDVVAAQERSESSATTTATAHEGNGNSGRYAPTFARLELENDDDLVFEVRAAMKAQAEVMATHAISKQSNIMPPNPKYV